MAAYRRRRRALNRFLSFADLQKFPKTLVRNLIVSTRLTREEFAYKASIGERRLNKIVRTPRAMSVDEIIKLVDVVKSHNPTLRKLTYDEFFVAITLVE